MCDPIPAADCPDCGYVVPGDEYPYDASYEMDAREDRRDDLLNDDHWYQIKEDRR